MTTVRVSGFGWVYVVVVLDRSTKQIVGYSAGLRCTAKQGLEALELEACSPLAIQPAFTSDNNPQGHAATERCMHTLIKECFWLKE